MVDASQSLMWVVAELGPEAQVGGLGEVARRLPPLLAKAGMRVRIAVPGYPRFARAPVVSEMNVLGHRVCVESSKRDGVILDVFRCDPLFDRASVYGDVDDDAYRFGIFGLAAVSFAQAHEVTHIHAHDWQTALVPVFVRQLGLRMRTVLTLHNVAYQGVTDSQLVPRLGLPWTVATDDGLGFGWQRINLLKGGILAADRLSTVSETHARDICTPQGGFGLHETLYRRRRDLQGIMNGIASDAWDPERDPALVAHVPDAQWKRKNAAALRDQLAWPQSERPLVCSVGRLVEQKGIDVLIATAYMQEDLDLLIIGQGEQRLENEARALQQARPQRVRAAIVYDDALTRLALGAADFFVMPSRFEPAGLAQMQAQRYGAIPIVRRTGGLAETVIDMGERSGANGICFMDASVASLSHAFGRALALWREPSAYRALQSAAMQAPVDWRDRVPRYLALYG